MSIEKDITGFYITMDNAFGMSLVESRRNGPQNACCVFHTQSACLNPVRERAPVHITHHEIRLTF